MTRAATLPAAARELGVSVATLRRWLHAGAPQTRRGARGRGRATLVNPAAIVAWRASRAVTTNADASRIPDLIADGVAEAFEQAEGLPKQRAAGFACHAWYSASTRVLDHLRESDPTVPDVASVPLAIERLRKIATR